MPIPEKIKIGDKEYSIKEHPELASLVEEARKEEKTKLYTQISTLEAAKKVLEDEKSTHGKLSSEKETELAKLREEIGANKALVVEKEKEIEKLKKARGADDDDDDDDEGKPGKKKTAKKESGLTKEDVAELLKQQQETFDKKLEEAQKGFNGVISEKDVAAYREKQIKQFVDDGVLIEDFVPEGLKTKEEVNAAIQKGIEKSKSWIRKDYKGKDGKTVSLTLAEYEEKMNAEKKEEEGGGKSRKTETYVPSKFPDKPDVGNPDISDAELLSKVGEMTDEEYEKNRDRIMRQAKSVKYTGSVESGEE